MLNIESLLKKAHSYFAAKEYSKALFLYSQITSQEPTNIEYQLYCLFCDLGYENDEKAQTLFDYFIIAKDDNIEVAKKYVQDALHEYDRNNSKMMKLLNNISTTNVESLNAIAYQDFMKIVKNRGSFKLAYQDIMFSTKVSITSKDDLWDFIDKLIENNFDKTAYSYLDEFHEFFAYDKNLKEMYEKLGKKNSGNKS
jgi:hypothetical protein